eukprot:g2406.t1
MTVSPVRGSVSPSRRSYSPTRSMLDGSVSPVRGSVSPLRQSCSPTRSVLGGTHSRRQQRQAISPAAARFKAISSPTSPLVPRAVARRSPGWVASPRARAPTRITLAVQRAAGLPDRQLCFNQDPFVRATSARTQRSATTDYVWGGGADPCWQSDGVQRQIVLDLRRKSVLEADLSGLTAEHQKLRSFPRAVLLEVVNSNLLFDDRVACAILNFSEDYSTVWVEHPSGGSPTKAEPVRVGSAGGGGGGGASDGGAGVELEIDLAEPMEVAMQRAEATRSAVTAEAFQQSSASPRSQHAGRKRNGRKAGRLMLELQLSYDQ